MKELISYLIEDMKQPITYIPAGIVVGILLAGTSRNLAFVYLQCGSDHSDIFFQRTGLQK